MTPFRRSPLALQLAFSQLHEWLPCPSETTSGNLGQFGKTLAEAGIQRIGFLRHGKTAPAENGKDFERQLTDAGRKQACEAGSSFGVMQKPFFPRVLVSPAPRTMETAKLFCDAAQEDVLRYFSPNILYDGTIQPEGSKLFRKIGYAPLQDYLDAEDIDDRVAGRTVLGAYSYNAAQVMMDTVEDTPRKLISNVGTTLWLVGHAIYLPAVALGIASLLQCNENGKSVILSTDTAEAEAYLIDVSSRTVSYLTRPISK